MIGQWLTSTALAAIVAAAPVAAPWSTLGPDQRAQVISDLHQLPLKDRLLGASERFLETPYVHSPLGEGAGKDPDPTERYDAVDCLTYVEETIALSLGETPAEASSLLQSIRYASDNPEQQVYLNRNHLMEAEWLPNNVHKGFIRDVTRVHGSPDVVVAEKVLGKATWTSKSSLALEFPAARQVTGRFPLPIIPLDKVRAHAKKIPSGTLLIVVREDLPLKPTRITHLGFVVQKNKRTFLRHASRNPFARVIDEDLENFLTRNGKYEKWRVSGVALYEVLPRPVVPAVADGH